MQLYDVIRETESNGYGGRVAVGHVTKLSALPVVHQMENYGIAVGGRADLVVFPCRSGPSVVAEIAPPLSGIKNGRRSFTNRLGELHRP